MSAILRVLVRTGAELLVTLGAVVVAFAAYLMVWSDVQNAAAQSELRETFEAQVVRARAPRPRRQPRPRGVPAIALTESSRHPSCRPPPAAGSACCPSPAWARAGRG